MDAKKLPENIVQAIHRHNHMGVIITARIRIYLRVIYQTRVSIYIYYDIRYE